MVHTLPTHITSKKKSCRLKMATYRDGVKRKGDKIGMGLVNVHNNEVVPKSLTQHNYTDKMKKISTSSLLYPLNLKLCPLYFINLY